MMSSVIHFSALHLADTFISPSEVPMKAKGSRPVRARTSTGFRPDLSQSLLAGPNWIGRYQMRRDENERDGSERTGRIGTELGRNTAIPGQDLGRS